MYDQRSKAQRDYEWGLASARQEALEEGHDAGLKQGLEQGHKKGLSEGVLIGKIQLLQELVGESVSSTGVTGCSVSHAAIGRNDSE